MTTTERKQLHAELLQRAENALCQIETDQERNRARAMLSELKERGATTTYNDNLADFFARCGFHIGGNTQNKYLHKIKFSIDE